MTNFFDWTNDIRRHFDLYGVIYAGAEISSGMEFVQILGKKEQHATNEQISVDIHLITEDFAAVEEALADGFSERFELELTSEERTYNFDRNTEVTLHMIQRAPVVEWVEL